MVSETAAHAAAAAGCKFHPREPIKVKNRVQPVPIYEVEWKQVRNAEL